ncbi:3-keto-5-aminohexanoate cleavage protein [Rhizobium sp. NZLR1]|uniref:3-keto-5-aminohexanoate cleavage protein n=1 Tax=Rhizobium sp. NZLR1 TaxID=2731096 RepID=UPI001A99CBB3|nr:3-keto-5-aminohexanoate cleavage protein [Rhizobium sp. NZLR1]MBX5204121.1 3-keto-5-aminohexanoate cleavage protein [Rhizobium sp. NZLR1]QSZ25088.1 3-keto-5-aminohexanoate cleavage protein [Rhizobium sp. NZLR1]
MNAKATLNSIAVAVAPNGGRGTKADHPAIPLTPAELARTAAECLEAGAAMIHVHVRKPDGCHLLDADAYHAVIAAIEAEVGDRIIVQITSEALGIYQPHEQIAVVKAVKPEAVSLALRELVPDETFEAEFAELLLWTKRERILPQIILYDQAEAFRLADFMRRGLVPWGDIPVLFVLGRYSVNQLSQPNEILPFLAMETPRFAHWSVCAFGRYEAACVTTAALLGGNVRVGFENNISLPDGTLAKTNADLVGIVRKSVETLGVVTHDGEELRERLHKMLG